MGALAALLPLALQLAPGLARYLGGAGAEATAGQVADVIRTVTGTDDPAAAAAAIRDPAVAAQVQIRLAEIQAAREAEAHRALLADVAGARAQTVALAQAGSPVQWAPVVMSAIVLTALAVLVYLVMYKAVPAGSETLAAGLVETLKLLAVSVVGYWCGSSAGSAQKTDAMAGALRR